MTAQIRAEVLKIRSTRTTLGLVIGMLVIVVAFTLLSGLLQHERDLQSAEDQRQLLGIGSIAGLFAALAGILIVTSEYRFGTIRPTFLIAPSWARIVIAKLVATFVVGVVFGVIAIAISYGLGYLCLSSRGIDYALSGRDELWLTLGSVLGIAIWGSIGVAVGVIVRNQVGAIIGILAWGFVVENLLFGLLPGLGRYVPGQAANALQGSSADHLLSPGLGGIVMLAWLLGLSGIGLAWTSRRDIA
jgi:ABC-type transport system involved in multi-copper enzyme maturation permease subunit